MEAILNQDNIDEEEDAIMLGFLVLAKAYLKIKKVKKSKIKRRWWVRKVNLTRNINGYFIASFIEIKKKDPENFFRHTRMSLSLYNVLLNLLTPYLTKCSMRESISPECRLAITLTYLSQGVTHHFLSWSWKIGRSTVYKIILETCEVIWKCLAEVYVSVPNEEDYKRIVKDFEEIWDLPNCVGAIDGKHISIQKPPNSGSNYYKYKKDFSIVLMAACDARYMFTAVDIGAYGGQSDGGILANSEFGKQLLEKKLPLPRDKNLPNTNIQFPHYFIGDPAFPLKNNILRAYPGKLLTPLDKSKRIFNYRISRARVTIENTFGILVARWRVLKNSLTCWPENAEKIVLATIALHNFIKMNDKTTQAYCPPNFVDTEDEDCNLISGGWRDDHEGPSIFGKVRRGSNNASVNAFQQRDLLKSYFLKEGKIEKQNKIR